MVYWLAHWPPDMEIMGLNLRDGIFSFESKCQSGNLCYSEKSGPAQKVPDSREVAFIFAKGLYVRGLFVQGLYEHRQGALCAGTLHARQNV